MTITRQGNGTAFLPVWKWVWNRPLTTLFVAFLIVVVSGVLASRLQLRTNFAELLPSADPAVEELHRLAEHVGGTAIMQIAIQSPDREANLEFAGAVAERVRALGPTVVSDATYDVRTEQAFFHDRRFLYAPLDDLVALRDALRSEIDRKKNPLLVDLLDEESVDDVVARMKKRTSGVHLFPTGYFEADEGHLVVIVCHPVGGLFAERAGEKLANGTRRIIAELDPKRFDPRMQVGLTGDVMSQIEERAALESDLASATGLCVSLVVLVMVIYFGRLRAVPLVVIPALIGVAVAFGLADLLFGYLNASTAFMGSIVVGNGINFPIIVLARYEEERRAGADSQTATIVALRATMRPTAIAALGAAISYASLMATRFRGFSQFGAIGGIGMVAAWLASMLVLPALIARFDRRPAKKPKPRRHGAFSGLVSRLATRAPRTSLALFALLTLVAIVPLPHYLHDPFEYDFRNLRNRKSVSSGAASLSPVVERVFGETLTPAVVLSDTRAHTGEIRHKILERDRSLPGGPLIGRIATLDDFLPGDEATQQKKLAVLKELRDILHSPSMRLASDEQRAKFAELDETDKLQPVHDHDVPIAIRRQFTELDGTIGR
ncbi:MAG: MMPL family transporter, partial [Polyangia bacterium]